MISFIETVVRLCVWIGHRRVTTSDERSFVRKILFEYWPWYVLENKETTKEQRLVPFEKFSISFVPTRGGTYDSFQITISRDHFHGLSRISSSNWYYPPGFPVQRH